MTLGWAEGIPAGDVAAIDAAGHDRKALGERVLRLFLLHALRDGYFHADMHQGNLKIAANGDIIALDFGIMGRLDDYTRRVYAEILMGFIRKDYRRVAEVHFEAGYVPGPRHRRIRPRAPVGGRTDLRHGCLAHLDGAASHLSLRGDRAVRDGDADRADPASADDGGGRGVSRSLYPNINIWEVARPVVEDYIRRNIGPRALLNDLVRTAQVLGRFGPKLPGRALGFRP
jgi:ubiquinone biosynthesis protein